MNSLKEDGVEDQIAYKDAFLKLEEGYSKIMEALGLLGYSVGNNENFKGTVNRASKAFLEMVVPKDEIERIAKKHLSVTFPTDHDDLTFVPAIEASGMCPHHLLPVLYKISIGYIPSKEKPRIFGASKLTRAARVLAQQPLCQEDVGQSIAKALEDFYTVKDPTQGQGSLELMGCGVYIEGRHMCMEARGVRAHESLLITNAVRGVFLKSSSVRAEFMSLVNKQR